ncbi:hypothetical protein O4H53_17320 [Sulfitobacter sp. G21635-S1]|uniref:hypothetical protein n=1 Tax=Sulfitobacter sp. G21635-S1 TaxID=3014043 RepID=UPI0022AF99CB|nr:hypothetical protein [Sulfitobacter sp. G21635-S1]MCZ4257314.1 hypothetical protein [Sulfitobacter sp. G21635-S1]
MRQGYEQILRNAEQEVEYVGDLLKELVSAQETKKLWRAWSGILDHYVKAVSALRRATIDGSSKWWSDKLLAEQKSDPLLQFAFQARHNANHVFEGKRDAQPRRVSIGGVSFRGNGNHVMEGNVYGNKGGRFRPLPSGNIVIKDGQYIGGTIPNHKVVQYEHFVILTAVKTQGRVYPVPNPKTDRSKQALEISEHVYDWLQKKLREALKMAEAEKGPEGG